MKFSNWLKESVKLIKEAEDGIGVDASDDIRYSSENLVTDINNKRIGFVATMQDVLEVLGKGVEEFNNWRTVNKVARLDLIDFDLSNKDLHGIDLKHCNLARANLSGTNLSGADLTGASLYGTNLSGADLTGANLSDSYIIDISSNKLKGTKLKGANFKGAKIKGTNLRSGNLKDIDSSFVEKNVHGIDISKLDQDLDYDDYIMFFKEFNEKSQVKIVAVKGALESSLEVPLRAVAKLSDGRFIKISSKVNNDEELVILTLVDKTGNVIKKVKFDMMYQHFASELLKLTK